LGTLLVCLGFFLAIPSILALIIWIAFFLIYDKMATYEEKDLRRILGEEYAAYQKRVPKWFPRLVQ
jgi:protein-S-isoprenylcysteine O-methyltransferase Ste14